MCSDDNTRLGRLCITLKGFRDEAIQWRADSGIEQIWTEDREYVDGIDDANRGEKWIKPSTSDGRVTRQRQAKKSTHSTIFLNITKRYVHAAAAYVSDKLFRSDVSNYGMRPTPIPSLTQQVNDASPAMDESGQPMQALVTDEQGQPVMQPQMINGQPMLDNATGQPIVLPAQKPLTKGDVAKQVMDKAKDAAERAKTQIDDWLTESGINGQSRHVVLDGAMIGTGVLKGPFPEVVKHQAVFRDDKGIRLEFEEVMVPRSRRISAWNLYPDPSCGTDIHRGKYIFEDDEINSRMLSELKNDPSYISDAIDRVLEDGPKQATTGVSRRSKTWTKGKNEIFQIWYYHGYLSKEDLEACGYEFDQPEDAESGLMNAEDDATEDSVEHEESETPYPADEPESNEPNQWPCVVVMVNDVIIKATMSPFDSGRFPYHVFRWEYRDDHWAGTGVSRQMRTSQDGVNASVRLMHDNAGVSGAPILIIDRSKIVPADGSWSVGPHKVYYSADPDEGANVREAFTWILAPNLQVEMMNYIQFWMKMAEEETGMPMLIQGMQGDVEHTLGEAQLLNNNGSAMLRRVTNIYDDDVTKSHIGAYYEWLLIYGDDDEAKGDFTIDALGSSVLIERDANSQLLMQMLGISPNPAFGVDPELIFKEIILSQRFDYEKIKLSDEKKKEMASRQVQEDPRITAAKIAAQVKQGEWQARQGMQQSEQTFDAQQADLDREIERLQMKLTATIDAAQLDSDQGMNAEDRKTELARDVMKLKTQMRLAMQSARAAQVARPAVEPQGRAPNGQAFQR